MTPKTGATSELKRMQKASNTLIQMIVLVLFSDRMAQTNCRRFISRAREI